MSAWYNSIEKPHTADLHRQKGPCTESCRLIKVFPVNTSTACGFSFGLYQMHGGVTDSKPAPDSSIWGEHLEGWSSAVFLTLQITVKLCFFNVNIFHYNKDCGYCKSMLMPQI